MGLTNRPTTQEPAPPKWKMWTRLHANLAVRLMLVPKVPRGLLRKSKETKLQTTPSHSPRVAQSYIREIAVRLVSLCALLTFSETIFRPMLALRDMQR